MSVSKRQLFFVLMCLVAVTAGTASATTVPFTESFDVDASSWQGVGGAATYVATGGADGGGYISTTFNPSSAAADDTPVLFRGQDEFGSSGGVFEGNYITDGVTEYSMFVRHNATSPLNFFTRFSGPFNFPGAVAVSFVPVLPNTWTEVTIQIDALNPQFVTFEGSDFASVFGNVGHVQPGISVSVALAGVDTDITIDLDRVSIVPEPATAALLGLASLVMLRRRKKV